MTPSRSIAASRTEDDLCTRVLAEFHEMPGLTLTLPQAVRLFALEPQACERVLRALVDEGRLATDGRRFTGCWIGRSSSSGSIQQRRHDSPAPVRECCHHDTEQ